MNISVMLFEICTSIVLPYSQVTLWFALVVNFDIAQYCTKDVALCLTGFSADCVNVGFHLQEFYLLTFESDVVIEDAWCSGWE
jgi:hypothetical protein